MTNRSSTSIEGDAEQARERVSALLDELRHRISPGEVVDQVYDYARDGAGGDLVRTLGRQVQNNPLACMLITAGVGWLMFSERGRAKQLDGGSLGQGNSGAARHDVGEAAAHARDHASQTASDLGDATRSAWDSTADAANRAYGSAASGAEGVRSSFADMSSQASDMMARAQDTASGAGERISESARAARQRAAGLAERGRRGASRIAENGSKFVDYVQRQPLMLVSIGLAIGSAIAASLPSTETEDRLMGDASDEVKEGVKEFGQEQYARATAATVSGAEQALDEVEAEREDVGIVPPSQEEESAPSGQDADRTNEPVASGASRADNRD